MLQEVIIDIVLHGAQLGSNELVLSHFFVVDNIIIRGGIISR